MDSVIDEIPKNYFNASKSKLNKRHSKIKKKHRLSVRKDSAKMKDSDRKRGFWCILIVNVINVLLIAFLFFLYLLRRYKTTEELSCPIGFYGDSCQRNDFIDVIEWSSDEDFMTVDGECKEGYSFRTWAPGANQVRLVFKNEDDVIFSYYPMIKQESGFWFIVVCTCYSGAQYKFQVDYNSAQDGYSLSLGSVERTTFVQEVSNILVNSTSPLRYDYMPLPEHPIIYQIHLPTYRHEEKTPIVTIKERVATMQMAGVNVLELSGIEFLNCDEDKLTCWQDSSYSPGLLRPSLGSIHQWVELIDTIHYHNVSVVIDLNWEMFNKNSLLWSYHKHYQNYMERNNGTYPQDVGDVFRPAEYCNEDQCPLDLSRNSLNQMVLYSVLERYRNTFKIDGLRFIVNHCTRFIGGDCSNQPKEDQQNDAVLRDFWSLVRQLGFEIITSNKSSVPDYDFYLDTTVCKVLSEVQLSDNLHHPLLTILTQGNGTDPTQLVSPECYNLLDNRLYSRTNYLITSMVLSLFYFLPSDLHFFMGSLFMSEVPFTSEPKKLDLEGVGYHYDNVWFDPGYRFSKLTFVRDLMALREEYVNEFYSLEIVVDDTEKQVMCLQGGSAAAPLLFFINYGRKPYKEKAYHVNLHSFHPYLTHGNWETLFTTRNSDYDINIATDVSTVTTKECIDNTNIKENACYAFNLPELTLTIFKPVITNM